MRGTHIFAILAGFAGFAILAAEASAVYHPTLGRFMQRDPGPEGPVAPRIGQHAIGGQYADGMDLYQYARGAPVDSTDPWGMEAMPVKPPCCATIGGTRVRLHATVEAKSAGRIRYVYAHRDDSDVGSSWLYSHSSDNAYIGVTEGRPDSANPCVGGATIYGSTGPGAAWAGWAFVLSAEARYHIVVSNVACESGRLGVKCEGTQTEAGGFWCPEDATYLIPKGESRSLPGEPWVGLAWVQPATNYYHGTSWIVLAVTCGSP